MGFGWIIGLIILGFIVWLVYSYNIQWHSGQRHSESPENILRERFAKGEISKKEYDSCYGKPCQECVWDDISKPWKTYVVKKIKIVETYAPIKDMNGDVYKILKIAHNVDEFLKEAK